VSEWVWLMRGRGALRRRSVREREDEAIRVMREHLLFVRSRAYHWANKKVRARHRAVAYTVPLRAWIK